jgi:hypothetical protein
VISNEGAAGTRYQGNISYSKQNTGIASKHQGTNKLHCHITVHPLDVVTIFLAEVMQHMSVGSQVNVASGVKAWLIHPGTAG